MVQYQNATTIESSKTQIVPWNEITGGDDSQSPHLRLVNFMQPPLFQHTVSKTSQGGHFSMANWLDNKTIAILKSQYWSKPGTGLVQTSIMFLRPSGFICFHMFWVYKSYLIDLPVYQQQGLTLRIKVMKYMLNLSFLKHCLCCSK